MWVSIVKISEIDYFISKVHKIDVRKIDTTVYCWDISPNTGLCSFSSENPNPSYLLIYPFYWALRSRVSWPGMHNLGFSPFVSNHICKINIFEFSTIITPQDVRRSKQREDI